MNKIPVACSCTGPWRGSEGPRGDTEVRVGDRLRRRRTWARRCGPRMDGPQSRRNPQHVRRQRAGLLRLPPGHRRALGDYLQRTIEMNQCWAKLSESWPLTARHVLARQIMSLRASQRSQKLAPLGMFSGYTPTASTSSRGWRDRLGHSLQQHRPEVIMQMDIGKLRKRRGDPIGTLRKFPVGRDRPSEGYGGPRRRDRRRTGGTADHLELCGRPSGGEWYVVAEGGADGLGSMSASGRLTRSGDGQVAGYKQAE